MSVNYCSGRVVRASAPSPSPARGRRRAAGRRGRVDGADNLDSQRQVSRPSETDWHCNGRAAGHRCREHNLHPAVIRVHRLSGDFSWPRNVRIEREQLRSWQSEKIVALKCPTECVINLRAPYRSAPDIQGAQLQRALNFLDRLRLQLGPLLRVRMHASSVLLLDAGAKWEVRKQWSDQRQDHSAPQSAPGVQLPCPFWSGVAPTRCPELNNSLAVTRNR